MASLSRLTLQRMYPHAIRYYSLIAIVSRKLNLRKIELFKRDKLLVHNPWLRRFAVILAGYSGHSMKPAIAFRIFCKGNSISINGTIGINAAAARTTSALTPKGKNLILFTVS
jgi:hypothetical protein